MSDEHCVFAGGLRNGQIARLAVAKFGRRNFHETQALILNAAHKFDRAVLRTRIDDQDVEAEAGFLREHCRQNAAKDLPGFLVGMMTDALTAVGVAPDLKLVIYAGIGESLALQVLLGQLRYKIDGPADVQVGIVPENATFVFRRIVVRGFI